MNLRAALEEFCTLTVVSCLNSFRLTVPYLTPLSSTSRITSAVMPQMSWPCQG